MESGTRHRRIEGVVSVVILDPDGDVSVPLRGWRGRLVFMGRRDGLIADLVVDFSSRMNSELALHGVVECPDQTWLVLRSSSRYSRTNE